MIDSHRTHNQPINDPYQGLSWRDQRYRRFYEVVDKLVDEVQAHSYSKTGKPKRRLKNADLDKLAYSVECLVRDCIAVVFQRKRLGEASIKRGQHHYPANRTDPMLTYSIHIERAFTALLEMGYLVITQKGRYDRVGKPDGSRDNRLTRFVASDTLLGLFTEYEQKVFPVIVPPLKNPQLIRVRRKEIDEYGLQHKVALQFEETEETTRIRSNLETINKALNQNWYDLEIDDDELAMLQKQMAGEKEDERELRFERRSLYRVFNDPELLTGGRFYGGWWQNLRSGYRHRLIVNGKAMVELDYSNQHPTILYAWEGAVRPHDCYSDIIQPKKNTHDHKGFRKQMKRAFNAMLNADKPFKRVPNGISLWHYGLRWREVSKAIMAFHKPIAHHFYTGVGMRLQRKDSDIAEYILLHFTKRGIPILPLHDSFLMHHGYETSLEPIMIEAFEAILGVTPKIDKKVRKKRKEPLVEDDPLEVPKEESDEFGEPVTDDIEELLASMQGHDRRLNAFYSMRSA